MTFRKGVTLLLLFAMLLALLSCLFGCGEKENVKMDDLPIKDSEIPPYSDEGKEYCEQVMLSFLNSYYDRENGTRPSEDELLDKAKRLASVFESGKVSEEIFLSFIGELENNSEQILNLFSSSGESVDTGRLISELTGRVGAEYLGTVLYGLSLFVFDEQIEKNDKLYESTGKAHYLVAANNRRQERELFVNEIGEKNCVELIKLALMFKGGIVTGGIDKEALDRFSDAEILTLLSHTSLPEPSLGKEGYKLIWKYAFNFELFGDSFFADIFYKAFDNGDYDGMVEAVDELLSLLSSVKERLTKEDVALLRGGDKEGFSRAVFEDFSEEDWALFETICSVGITRSSYNTIAEKHYGEDFKEYSGSLTAVSLEELRFSVTEEDFYKKLEGFVYGISPAFSYGMSR